MNRADYIDYLRSPEWKVKRRRAIERAGHVCEICGRTRRLEVHHCTYVRLGKERLSDLAVACRSCHRWIHRTGRGAWSRRRLLKKR